MKSSFFLFGALLLSSGTSRAQDIYRTYRNARYGTVVRYAANLVAPQPESANGDGRKFVSRDGQIELTVYAFRNLSRRSARGEMDRAIRGWKGDGARLTYFRNGNSWFVLSGYLGADIFYEKTLLRNGVFHTLIWQYPRTLRTRLDAAVSWSTASFSVANSVAAAPTPTSTPQPRRPRPQNPAPRPRRTPKASPAAPANGY